jgi:hypothetical protein
VPGFLSSRPNRLPSPPHPQASVAPHPLVLGGGGEGTLACGKGGGGSRFGRRDKHSGTLGTSIVVPVRGRYLIISAYERKQQLEVRSLSGIRIRSDLALLDPDPYRF